MDITRRSLLAGSVVAAATLSAGAAVPATRAHADEARNYASEVVDTRTCDIVVVGAGMSGLAAAVEALNLGANVLVLESQASAGGNGSTTSCVMGVGTELQKKLGIEVTPAQIMETEMQTFNYASDGTRWAKVIADSSANLDWLVEQGCHMRDDLVDNYGGMGVYDTAHWWVGDTGRDGNVGFVKPMCARVEELGGTIAYETAGKQLILDEVGTVCGLFAEGPGGVIQIDAAAVVIATGGYADNFEMVGERGYNTDELEVFGMPGHNGDGIKMTLVAGGASWLENSSLMEYPINPQIGRASYPLSSAMDALWVNGRGERFVNEACSAEVPGRAALAVRSQERSYVLFDQALLDAMGASNDSLTELVEQGASDGAIFTADTVEGLAAAAGIDAETLAATVAQYNEACATGEDALFGKGAEHLVALATAPYYLNCNSGIYFLTTIGGIDTTPDCEVRAADGGIIEGLYAVGVDGVELYHGLYTIDIPGSCNANNIWTGRHAAQMACARL